MARIEADRSLDLDNIDLYRMNVRADRSDFLDDAFVRLNGVRYRDVYEVLSNDGSISSDFGGDTLVYDRGTREIVGGTVTGITEFVHAGGGRWDHWWSLEGISASARALWDAGQTPSTSDDMAILREELSGADTFLLSGQADRARGHAGQDLLQGMGGADSLYGGSGGDKIYGGSGNDSLHGDGGDDLLSAGTGRDTLEGGAGRDLLVGGTDGGRDVFVFGSVKDSAAGRGDEIRNFTRVAQGGDRIDLRGIDADTGTRGDDAFAWSGQTARAHSVWWVDAGADLVLRADVDGDAVSDLSVRLVGRGWLSDVDVWN